MSKTMTFEEELTPEGLEMWNNIGNLEKLANGESLLPQKRLRRIRLNMFEIELVHVRTELRRMIKNSQAVIDDCDQILKKIKTQEDYFKCEARVAKSIHTNLIVRLQRILDSKDAFDHNITVDDEPKRYEIKQPPPKK